MAENKLSSPKSILIFVIILFVLIASLSVASYLSSVKNTPPVAVQPTEEPTVTLTPIPIISSSEPKATQKEETTILQNNGIWILNKDFIDKFKLADGNETITKFSFSPDGKEIYWLNGKEIWKRDFSGKIKLLTKASEVDTEAIKKRWVGIDWVNSNEIDKLKGGIENFTLSPDGKYIVYDEIVDYTTSGMSTPDVPVTGIWIMRADGSEQVKIKKPSEIKRKLMVFDKWFPDSKKILFHFRDSDEPTQGSPFFEIGIDGKNLKVYTAIYQGSFPGSGSTIVVVGADPIFSPDGTKMTYIEDGERLWMANIDGKEKKMILETHIERDFPMNNASDMIKWSESGNSLSIITANKNFIFDNEGEIIFESQ